MCRPSSLLGPYKCWGQVEIWSPVALEPWTAPNQSFLLVCVFYSHLFSLNIYKVLSEIALHPLLTSIS